MNQQKIGKFIYERRKLKKITQSELAEKLGVTDRTISNWENGKNMPDLSLFKPLCNELDITINELLSGEKINNKEYPKKLEENIINTIDYIDKKNIQSNDKKNIFFLLIGVIGILLTQFIIKNKEIQNYTTVVCMILSIYCLKQLCIKYRFARRIVALILVLFCILILILNV